MRIATYFAEAAMRARDHRPVRRRALKWPRLGTVQLPREAHEERGQAVKAPRVYVEALRALWLAVLRCRGKCERAPPGREVSHARRSALQKLGGACACCGLGIEYARVLELHHVNHNGDLHHRLLRAFSSGVVTWVLETPAPGLGLFAVEVRCVICHRMLHEAGACPHGRKERVKRAA